LHQWSEYSAGPGVAPDAFEADRKDWLRGNPVANPAPGQRPFAVEPSRIIGRVDQSARRSVILLAVILGAMAIFAAVYLLSGGATPDPSPLPSAS
jgi:hypothetical protein